MYIFIKYLVFSNVYDRKIKINITQILIYRLFVRLAFIALY